MDFQITLKWYYILLLVIPAFITALVVNPISFREWKSRREKKKELRKLKREIRNLVYHEDQEWAEKRRQFLTRKIEAIKQELYPATKMTVSEIPMLFLQFLVTLIIGVFPKGRN